MLELLSSAVILLCSLALLWFYVVMVGQKSATNFLSCLPFSDTRANPTKENVISSPSILSQDGAGRSSAFVQFS